MEGDAHEQDRQEGGLTQAFAGGAPTLDVELEAFEEIEKPRRALFRALISMHDEQTGLLQQTVTIEEPLAPGKDADPAVAIVDALSRALTKGVAQISKRVVARLSPP